MSVKESLDRLREAIDWLRISAMSQPQWIKRPAGNGTDALGEYAVGMAYSNDTYLEDPTLVYWYFALTPGEGRKNIVVPYIDGYFGDKSNCPDRDIPGFDFSAVETLHIDQFASHNNMILPFVRRLIFPKRYIGHSSKFLCEGLHTALSGVYLPKEGNMYSDWVANGSPFVEVPVKCPQGATCPYFLNKIGVSVEDMVGIFNNMADRSGEPGTQYITLGSTNLAKLTEEQKEIAYAKGWDLK